jgi:hypothetical protein
VVCDDQFVVGGHTTFAQPVLQRALASAKRRFLHVKLLHLAFCRVYRVAHRGTHCSKPRQIYRVGQKHGTQNVVHNDVVGKTGERALGVRISFAFTRCIFIPASFGSRTYRANELRPDRGRVGRHRCSNAGTKKPKAFEKIAKKPNWRLKRARFRQATSMSFSPCTDATDNPFNTRVGTLKDRHHG